MVYRDVLVGNAMPTILSKIKVGSYLLSFIGIGWLLISNNKVVGIVTVVFVCVAAALSIASIPFAVREKRKRIHHE